MTVGPAVANELPLHPDLASFFQYVHFEVTTTPTPRGLDPRAVVKRKRGSCVRLHGGFLHHGLRSLACPACAQLLGSECVVEFQGGTLISKREVAPALGRTHRGGWAGHSSLLATGVTTSACCRKSSIIVAADESTISWGPSPTFGELVSWPLGGRLAQSGPRTLIPKARGAETCLPCALRPVTVSDL